jgi:hypothetical protein
MKSRYGSESNANIKRNEKWRNGGVMLSWALKSSGAGRWRKQ